MLCTRRAWSNRPDNWKTGTPGEFYLPAQKMFEDWLESNPDVDIVLSSTWRIGKNPNSFPFGWKFRIGKESKIILDRIVDVTPRLGGDLRGAEIKAFLDTHPEIEKYAIIDDDSDMLPEQKQNFIQTRCSIGMTRATLQSVEEILGISKETQ